MSKKKLKVKIQKFGIINQILDKFKKTAAKSQLILLVLALSVAVFCLVYLWSRLKSEPGLDISNQDQPSSAMVGDGLARHLDGVLVAEGEENLTPIAVMIDNHVDSWPLAALTKAQLVYEAPAEGGLSRILAIYSPADDLPKIGPVRSARPYFVDWAKELGAIYIHCGGSPEALSDIQKEYADFDVNEFYQGEYFWRDDNRARPHNVFTSSKLMASYQTKKELTKSADFIPWQFADDAPLSSNPSQQPFVSFNYSTYPQYQIKWLYNSDDNNYQRLMGGTEFKDSDNQLVTAKNIIIQFVKSEILDAVGRRRLTLIGQGEILIIQNGVNRAGTWQKPDDKTRTKFYYQDGSEVKFVRGTTWVQVLPVGWEILTINN
ncbi:MAG: DUF3048 domain-containing protein [Patescibacteria group bacterium]